MREQGYRSMGVLLAVALLAVLPGAVRADAAAATSSAGSPAADSAASSEAGTDQADQAATAADAHIDWYKGEVEEAFDEAAAQHKPLLLYWGAAWCPPCNELKRTIFQRPEFVARTRDFIPVYLDGDSQSAQRWGEYFGVVGYPTVVILAPDRTEITRIPGDLDIERYSAVLDLARQRMAPVKELVSDAMAHPQTLTEGDWTTLAYYAWDEDEGRTVPEDQLAPTLAQLAAACPPVLGEAGSRLFVAALEANAARAKDPIVDLPPEERSEALKRIESILASPALSRASAPDLIWSAPEIVAGLTPPKSLERMGLVKYWNAALDRFAGDDSLSTMERLGTVYTRIGLFKMDHPKDPLPDALVQLARAQVDWADKRTTEPHERQSVVNAADKVFRAAGLDQDAEQLLTAELDRSPAPYYFMEDLAELAQQTGDNQRALYWLKRAYDSASGPATRFQWGVNYVYGLIDMTPSDKTAIHAATAKLLKELQQHPDALYQRTRSRFAALSARLLDWGRDHDGGATLKALRAQAGPLCLRIPAAQTDARKSCSAFLAGTA